MPKIVTMNRKEHKLQTMLVEVPDNGIVTSKWLRSKGIYSALLNRYLKGGWLKKVGPGAYCKSSDHPTWFNGLQALQIQLGMPAYVGGKSALEYQGHSHFVSMNDTIIDIFYPQGTKLPGWFKTHLWSENLRLSQSSIIKGDVGIESLLIATTEVLGSSRERAVLELLHFAPRFYDFEEVRLIMEAMGTLRPNLLRELLSSCSSQKARRLLLYFGEMMNHSWRKYLDDLSLVRPKYLLKIVKSGGRYEAKYNLFIPEEYIIKKEENVIS